MRAKSFVQMRKKSKKSRKTWAEPARRQNKRGLTRRRSTSDSRRMRTRRVRAWVPRLLQTARSMRPVSSRSSFWSAVADCRVRFSNSTTSREFSCFCVYFSHAECWGGSFGYENRPLLYHNLNFGIDLKSRIALVGPNGAGKSTLMKLMCCDLDPISGSVNKHHHLRIARFHQHLTDQLELSMTAVAWLCRAFNRKPQEMRDFVGKFGLHGKSQTIPMEQLSDGQKRRVVFAWLSLKNAHLLMLDEPTNHLDIETIDALAEAIRAFDGGVVLISHDFRLINQVAEEIWIVEDGTMDAWPGSIGDYKQFLKTELQKPLA